MSTALVPTRRRRLTPQTPCVASAGSLAGPHNVSPGELSAYIQQLEQACLDNPRSADLRTCLGMAHAVNYDVYKSMDALEDARAVDPENFWAQLKYAELHYRLRALNRAEEETRRAADLAAQPVAAGGRPQADEGDPGAAAHGRPQRPLDEAADGADARVFGDGRRGVRDYDVEMKWKFFIGSCIIVAGVLIKFGAPIVPVAIGIAGAAFITWKKLQRE